MTTTMRRRLPDRRYSETFSIICAGLPYTCTWSPFDDGSIGEVFLDNHKSGTAADTAARDSAIVFSIAVQFGADPETIRKALCRDPRGNPSGPLGVALDRLTTITADIQQMKDPATTGAGKETRP
jgi:hypothetical protein